MAPSPNHPTNGHTEPPPPPPSATPADVAVVMVPLPAQGHLNQLLHLSRLISSHHIPVHYVAAATHLSQAKLRLQGWDPATNHRFLHFHGYEIPPFPSPPPDPNSPSKFPSQLMPAFIAASSGLRRHVAALVNSLLAAGARRVVVVHDSLMSSAVQDVSSVSNAESYTFRSVSAFSVYWYIAEAARGRTGLPEEEGGGSLGQPPALEGCFPAEFLKFIEDQYTFRHLSSGCLYNTSRVVEGVFIKLLEKEKADQNHWAVGPFNPVRVGPGINATGKASTCHKCIEWLDRHPRNSVIYVSFGTTVALSKAQIYEIATGLEKSGQRFLWVLREADRGETGLEERNKADHDELSLPKGFEERVQGVGLVVREWAPQLEILAHPSVGGFVSHCGWNSCMESITMGVPIAAWPMHSDQPSNSVLVTRFLGIGLMVKEWSALEGGGIVESSAIESAVKSLMTSEEGVEMRRRAAELGRAVRRSVADGGGASRAEMESFISHITR